MKARWVAWGVAVMQAALPAAAQPEADPTLVVLVGDSTMAPQTGYGDALCARFGPGVACLNLGRGGRSTRSYREEGLWQRVIARVRAHPGSAPRHVLIQFGHNDQPGKPGRSTDLQNEYPANLVRYVDELRAAGATPILVTPLTRRSFRGAQLHDDLRPWADAMQAVAKTQQVPLLDLHARSGAAVQAMGETQADLLAQAPAGAEGFDRTHLGARGACLFADQMAQLLAQQVPALAPQLQAGADCAALPPAGVSPPFRQLDRATYDHPGWAVGTMGGRGGRLLRVTNLDATGPGSLRAALEASGPRNIVFEVGGVIDLQGRSLRVREPFVTVAGQTAPSPGITLIRGGLEIATHDVIVQHFAVRPGAYGRAKRSGGDHDGLNTLGAHHVIVDHCSFSWATDENLSASGPRFDGADPAAWRRATSHTITFSHNLVYEGLADAVHAKGEHSKGSLLHDNTTQILLRGNLYASNRERNALFKGGAQGAMVNNLIVNPGTRAVHYNLIGHEWTGQPHQAGQITLVGNVLRHGPDTAAGTPLFMLGGQGDVELHLHDNLAVDGQGGPLPMTGRYSAGAASIVPMASPQLPARLPLLPAALTEDAVLRSAGARPWDRDSIDFKQLSDVAEDRGRIVDSEADSSGFPRRSAATTRRFDPAAWDLRDMSPKAGWASLFTPAPGRTTAQE